MLALETALTAVLETAVGADVTGIFRAEAPEGQAAPYVVWLKLPSVDEYTFAQRAKTDYIYQVSVHDDGHDQTRGNGIRDDIDAALTLQPLAFAGHARTVRESEFDFSTRDEGRTFQHIGATYRIQVKA